MPLELPSTHVGGRKTSPLGLGRPSGSWTPRLTSSGPRAPVSSAGRCGAGGSHLHHDVYLVWVLWAGQPGRGQTPGCPDIPALPGRGCVLSGQPRDGHRGRRLGVAAGRAESHAAGFRVHLALAEDGLGSRSSRWPGAPVRVWGRRPPCTEPRVSVEQVCSAWGEHRDLGDEHRERPGTHGLCTPSCLVPRGFRMCADDQVGLFLLFHGSMGDAESECAQGEGQSVAKSRVTVTFSA